MRPNRKLKKPKSPPKLLLRHVIGLTTKKGNGLDSCGSSSSCVYVAGCVLVVYNVDIDTQSHLMVPNRTPKPLNCVAQSVDGRFVAAGELGNQAAVLVWDCTSLAILSELKSHQYGVECIAFSPDGKHLVSVGFPRDGYICLWKWRSGILVTKLKACSSCSSVESVCFSSDANFIITAGKKHLKFWKILSSARTRANTGVKSLTVHGKPINLGNQKGCSFVAVTSPIFADNLVSCNQTCESPIYGLTDAGVLCVIRPGSSIRNSVDVKAKKAFALSASNELIACACNNGVVKLFTTEPLEYSVSLRRNEEEKCEEDDIYRLDESCKHDLNLLPSLPHAIACRFSTSDLLVVVYEDHRMYVWDIRDVQKATSRLVLVSHSGCIWDIKCLPCENMHDPSLACVSRGCYGGTSFATCSEDGTIKLWNLIKTAPPINDQILATDSNFKLAKPARQMQVVSSGIFKSESVKLGVSAPEFHSVAISSDGKYLLTGDTAMDPKMEVMVTVGQDEKVNVFSNATGKVIRSFKQGGDFGDAIKVILDPSSSFLVCSYSNRSIWIYDFLTGEIVARASGHGEIITGITFLPDCEHMVSVSGDGCIFIWKVPTPMSSKMLQKIKETARPLSPASKKPEFKIYEEDHPYKASPQEMKLQERSTPNFHRFSCQMGGLQEVSVFKFSISKLPKWAQGKVTSPIVISCDPDYAPPQQIGGYSSVGSHSCLDVQTPPKYEENSDEPSLGSIARFSTCVRQGSQFSQRTHRHNFALDGRWLTIHTVCLDFPTPGTCEMKDMKVIANAPFSEEPYLVLSEANAEVDVNSSCIKYDRNGLNQKLGNLAALLKADRSKSSPRSSYWTPCVLEKDLSNQKKLVPNGCFLSHYNSANCSTLDKQKSDLEECEEQNAIITCKEALLHLEKAAENAFHIFSKLGNLAFREDVLTEPKDGWRNEATEKLSSVTTKVNAVAEMVQYSHRHSGEKP